MTITKAELMRLDPTGTNIADRFPVQFNPESFKVTFQNQIVPPQAAAPDQSQGTAGTQHVGSGTTKLTLQLWFDVTGEIPNGLAQDALQRGDVRELTRRVVALITPVDDPVDTTKKIPPLVRFLWGSFLFEGIVDSMDQSLEFFSSEGIPLRAAMSLSLSQQTIENKPSQKSPGMGNTPAPGAGKGIPGTSPLAAATAGISLQGMAASVGKGGDWQGIALANNIENPRLLVPGQLVNLNIKAPTPPAVQVSTPIFSFGISRGDR